MKKSISIILTLLIALPLCLTGSNNTKNLELESPVSDFEYLANEEMATIKKYIGTDKNVVIPEKIDEKPVVAIDFCAFSNQSVEKVVIPSTVKLICDNAFYNCTSLKEVVFGDGITKIWQRAFRNCTELTEIKLPKKLEELGYQAFYNCTSLEKVHINKNLKKMYMEVFFNCPISELTFEDGLKMFGSYASFWSIATLKNIVIPASVEEIGEYSFHDNLESVTFLGDAPQKVGKQPFGRKAVIYYNKGTNGWEDTPLKDEYTLIAQ